jgi:hypothetical protein
MVRRGISVKAGSRRQAASAAINNFGKFRSSERRTDVPELERNDPFSVPQMSERNAQVRSQFRENPPERDGPELGQL